VLARWAYRLVPLSARGGVEVEMPNGKTVVVNKTEDGYGDVNTEVQPADMKADVKSDAY